jgi:hypothetical protein
LHPLGAIRLAGSSSAPGIGRTLTENAPRKAAVPEKLHRVAITACALARRTSDRLDGRDMQHGAEYSTVREFAPIVGGQTDVQTAPNEPGEFRMTNFIGVAAGKNHAKGLKRPTA